MTTLVDAEAEAPLIGIVDDDESIRNSISSLVRSAGFKAAVFPSAEAFLCSEYIQDTECLILDVQLPGWSGLDLQRQLAGTMCSIPIIFATAYGDDDVRTRALEQGAVTFLRKPFDDEVLLAAIHSALR